MTAGSMRQRGRGTWELRAYLGLDPDTGRRRYATRTVHGTRRAATVALAELVEDAAYSRLRAGTVGGLLERWITAASGLVSVDGARDPQPDALPPHAAPRPHPVQADRR
jgi:hypothetical protein